MKRPNPEFNAGCAQARKRILAFISRNPGALLAEVTEFIHGMAKRSAAHPGGQGRK